MLTDTEPRAADGSSVFGHQISFSAFMGERLDAISDHLSGMTNAERFWFGIGAAFQALEPMLEGEEQVEILANGLRDLLISYARARVE